MRSQIVKLVCEEYTGTFSSKLAVLSKKLWKHTAWCRIEQTKSEFQPLRIVVFAKGEQSGNIFCGGRINSDIPFPFPADSDQPLQL